MAALVLAAAWEWTTQLYWPEAVGQSGRHGGVTYVELLENFVAVTKTIPPLKETGAKVTAVDPLEASGVLYPVILKECIMTLVATVRFLERKSGLVLWHGKTHHKVRCLELVGHKQPKRGICPRPGLPKLDVTFGPVEDLFHAGWTERLSAFHRPQLSTVGGRLPDEAAVNTTAGPTRDGGLALLRLAEPTLLQAAKRSNPYCSRYGA